MYVCMYVGLTQPLYNDSEARSCSPPIKVMCTLYMTIKAHTHTLIYTLIHTHCTRLGEVGLLLKLHVSQPPKNLFSCASSSKPQQGMAVFDIKVHTMQCLQIQLVYTISCKWVDNR